MTPKPLMHTLHIRPATSHDLKPLLPLMEELGYPATMDELEARFERFKASGEIAIALLGESVIGWVAWTESPLIVSDATRVRIEGLVVLEEYRSQGVGQQLMGYVEERARRLSPAIIELTSGTHRTKSHDFYERLGYSSGSEKVYFRKMV